MAHVLRESMKAAEVAIIFSAEEVLRMAEQIERNGARFYRHVAETQFDERTQNTLLDLAAMEDRHEEAFAAMRAQLAETQREPIGFDRYQEMPLYLRAMADRRVFAIRNDPTERLTGRETSQRILELAIGFEKDSVVFYLGLKDLVPEAVGGVHVDTIIKEEMSHISILAGRLAELAA